MPRSTLLPQRISVQNPDSSQVSELQAPVGWGGDGWAPGGGLHTAPTSRQRPTAWLALALSHAILPWAWGRGSPAPCQATCLGGRVISARPPGCSGHVALAVSSGHFSLTRVSRLQVRTRGPLSFSCWPHPHRLRDAEAGAGHPRQSPKGNGQGSEGAGLWVGGAALGPQSVFQNLMALETSLTEKLPRLHLREQDLSDSDAVVF